jgi:hypothetical protein
MAGGAAQGEEPEFKSQYHKKKKSNEDSRGSPLPNSLIFMLMFSVY